MPLALNNPISWKSATGDLKTMLENLQSNIIKGHTREFLTVLFVKFTAAPAGRKFLKSLMTSGAKPLVKSALAHLQEVDAFNAAKRAGSSNPPVGTTYVGVGLSKKGYDLIAVPQGQQPADPAFRGGMKASLLNDPSPAGWDAHYRGDIHAVVLIGDSKPGPRNAALAKVRALIAGAGGVQEIGHEVGHSQHNRNGDGLEHFGYVDGRSQPLFLTEDLGHEELECDGVANWDPGFGPSRAVVPDPAAPNSAVHFGSYFVFRKLEQNVKQFKTQEGKLAVALGLKGDDRERAGAMIVGRFEDGTPLTSQFADGAHNPVQNNFNYDSDSQGGKCPFFGHIRKMNPRGSGGFEPQAGERMHIMARRGQTYGVRTDDLNDGKLFNKPTADVGLLFMAFNADLGQQFEFVQMNWANSGAFPAAPNPPGVDMVIGQVAGDAKRPDAFANIKWGEKDELPKQVPAVPRSVTMKGGEYFFMPSLPFLAAL